MERVKLTCLLTVFTGDQVLEWSGVKLTYLLTVFTGDQVLEWNGVKLTYLLTVFSGDQVLEWNGVKLTGKTYEEVQQIISQTNGEIELVVRA